MFMTNPIALKQRLARPRKGQGVIELTASLIIFVLMIAIMMSISAYLYTQHAFVTAARDGARKAAVNINLGDPSTEATGVQEIEAEVINSVAQLTGQSIDAENIVVTPPDAGAAAGDRTVSVDIAWDMPNPVNAAGFVEALGGNGEAFRDIPIFSTSTMRYEE